jgi:integrase
MNYLTTTKTAAIAEMVLRITQEAPSLASLNTEQLDQIARIVIAQRLTVELNTAVDAEVDWAKERDTFLDDTKSVHTRRAYASALTRLENWANREGVDPSTLTPAHADNFIRALKAEGRAPASTRRDIAAVSAFYRFMERYHAAIKNPFKGTRIRPANENSKEAVIPSVAEYKTIAAALPPIERAIVTTIALRGLRAGALPTLTKKGERYIGTSKGRKLSEGEVDGVTLPPKAVEAIAAAGLDVKKPFDWITANAIERRINYQIGKLYKAGTIKAAYSCHDFRHLFAKNEYEKDKDILRVSRLLNHTNLAATQTYLRTIVVSL